MEIVSSIYTNEELNEYISYIDAALLMLPSYSMVYENLLLDDAINKLRENNKKIILCFDKIMHPSDMKEVKPFILGFKEEKDIYFYVTDTGLLNYLLDLGLNKRIIYNPITMLCNAKDLSIFNSFGISLALSEEITLNDTIDIYNEVKPELFMMTFGYRLMFYSKRKLVSLYGDKIGKNIPLDNLTLKEATRPDIMPIIENNNGTMIYRSYVLNLFKNLLNISFIKYCYLDSLRINRDSYIKALKCFYDYKNGMISLEDGIKYLDNIGLNYEDGFLYKDSVYQKEELKND